MLGKAARLVWTNENWHRPLVRSRCRAVPALPPASPLQQQSPASGSGRGFIGWQSVRHPRVFRANFVEHPSPSLTVCPLYCTCCVSHKIHLGCFKTLSYGDWLCFSITQPIQIQASIHLGVHCKDWV